MAQGIAELRLGGKELCFAFPILMYIAISAFLRLDRLRPLVIASVVYARKLEKSQNLCHSKEIKYNFGLKTINKLIGNFFSKTELYLQIAKFYKKITG